MPAAEYDFTIEQGTTHREVFTWEDSEGVPMNLTGFTARMQFRRRVSSSTVLYEATTANGCISIEGATGTLNLTIPASTTKEFSWPECRYDLELVYPNGEVIRLVAGKVTNSKEVTR